MPLCRRLCETNTSAKNSQVMLCLRVESKRGKMVENQMKIHEEIVGKNEHEEERKNYEFYIPLNNLWKRYMKDLIEKEYVHT